MIYAVVSPMEEVLDDGPPGRAFGSSLVAALIAGCRSLCQG